ncbi:hypothetical protein DENIS_0494 [Desulfonema ishimotonii]|uniref:HhH-GPD domain-containing protein n=1 Tax=Desulfonema ishimotonii TaxID=45657 RepID=A0A401FRH1_9BACT|nr:endonuclease III [Desulfonema ishimotonii]GBC59555.1 hypothetical protein DENIS_0494 [Desulfonema ishimotonii]
MSDLAGKTERINDILEAFMGIPEEKCQGRDLLEQLIITILSQNTTDVNCFRAFETLAKRFRGEDGAVDWQGVADAPQADVADAIRVGGLGNQKSERIRNILQWVRREYGTYTIDPVCQMPPHDAIQRFTALKGIGVKTISIVLCFCCGTDIFPVDTHVNRICHRLGLVDEKASAEKTFWHMQDLVPPGNSFSLHLNMVRFGRRVCRARYPECGACPLTRECVWYAQNR